DKATIKVRDVLCHRSGLSAFHQQVPNESIFNWDEMIKVIQAETPWWAHGTAQGYSPFMFGWILGELVKRVSGAPNFNDYFQLNIAKPLGVNCHFGVPENLLSDIADTSPLKRTLSPSSDHSDASSASLGKIMKADPRGVTNRAFSNPISLMTATNTNAWRHAQIPAANAHANAAALATVYGDLANEETLLTPDVLPLCSQQQSFEQDRVLGLPLRFSNGFMLSQEERSDCCYGRGANAFGHPGAGGCVGFADPDFKIGFGYVTQRMGQSLLIDERAVRLINATYRALDA
ncbi:MAG: class A beta-lactamase-related serine hydrolase, partial [Moraxellaceae bacterium]